MAHRRGAVGRRMVRRKGALVWVTDLGNALLNVGTAQAFFIAEGLDWQRGSGQTISSQRATILAIVGSFSSILEDATPVVGSNRLVTMIGTADSDAPTLNPGSATVLAEEAPMWTYFTMWRKDSATPTNTPIASVDVKIDIKAKRKVTNDIFPTISLINESVQGGSTNGIRVGWVLRTLFAIA